MNIVYVHLSVVCLSPTKEEPLYGDEQTVQVTINDVLLIAWTGSL